MPGDVLIVEDDDDIRNDLASILEDEGYNVATAQNGRVALSYLSTATPRPSVILLDLMMPVMDGWQMRLELSKDPVLAGIPVIVLSAAGDVAREAAALGAAGYVNKPLELDSLFSQVEKYCGPPASRS